MPFLHVRFQNSCKKGQKCKKAESACSILKFMQKRQKCIFNYEIHTKKKHMGHMIWGVFILLPN